MKMRKPKIVFIILILWPWLILSLVYGQAEQLNPLFFPYISAVKARIEQVVNAAPLAKGQNKGVVKLKLLISREGKLKDVQVSESSGQSALDALAINGVQQVFPFIPFPAEIKEPEVSIELPVTMGKGGNVITTSLEKTAPVSSSSQTASQLILQNYISVALANYQPTKIAKEQVELALLKIKEVARYMYPTVSGEYKTSEGQTITDPYEAKNYGIQAEQLLLGLYQVWDSLKREKIGLEMAKKNYAKLESDIRYEVTKAYYGLIIHKALMQHWQDASQEINPDLALIQRLYDNGLVIASDLENIQSQHKLIKHQITSTEANVSLARLSLAQAMNVESSRADMLEAPLEFGFSAADLNVDLGQCTNSGLKYRPEVAIWEKTSESAKINELINRRENQPKLSVSSSYGRSGEAYATQKLDLVDTWSVMGKLSWLWGPSSMELSQTEDRTSAKNITETSTKTESSTSDIKFSLMDRLNYYTDRKEAQITYKQSLNELNESRKKVVYEVKEAYLAYQQALSEMQTNINRIEFRKKELGVIRARTEAGEGSPTELVEAKISLASDKAAYLRAMGDYYLAVAALDKATGYRLKLTK